MGSNYKNDKFKGQSSISSEAFKSISDEERNNDFILQDAGLVNIYNLRGSQRSSVFKKFVQSYLDVEIPNKTGTFTMNDKKYILQTSPDEWIILSNSNEINEQIIELEKKLSKVHFAINNLTDQYQVIYISGEKSRWVLSKGCSIDLDNSSFGPKECAQTTLALIDISIYCTSKNSFTVFCRNSFSRYLIDWLEDASIDCKYKFLKD